MPKDAPTASHKGGEAGFVRVVDDRTLAFPTFLLALNPVFHTHLLQPSLDFPLPVYLCVLLWVLLEKRRWSAVLVGLLLMFTKEPGVMIYGLVGAYYCLFFALDQPRRLAGYKRLVREYWPLALPFVAFALYSLLKPPHFGGAGVRSSP